MNLFLNIDKKKNLEIIKYNKSLQKKVYIDIIDYKIYSEKFIIYETNGYAKEFDIHSHYCLYEGGYSKGKRNGKGKEYLHFGI